MEKKKLSIKEAYEMVGLEYTFWDWITTPFYRIRRFFYDRWFNFRQRCQRFRRGYADSDVWDMAIFFHQITPAMNVSFATRSIARVSWVQDWQLRSEECFPASMKITTGNAKRLRNLLIYWGQFCSTE